MKMDRETTKLRIVHDASAKSEGRLSLNNALEKGPNLPPLLWGVLLRFRVNKVGVVGDLEKAFLQFVVSCGLPPKERLMSTDTGFLRCKIIAIFAAGCP